MLLSLRFSFSLYMVHGSKIQNSLHAYMILLKLPMNKRIDAFASLHKAYMEPTCFWVFTGWKLYLTNAFASLMLLTRKEIL